MEIQGKKLGIERLKTVELSIRTNPKLALTVIDGKEKKNEPKIYKTRL